jgi:hypothetical protein
MGITVRLVGLQPYLLDDIYRDPTLLDRTGNERVTAGRVDLDKAWAGIDFLLGGEPDAIGKSGWNLEGTTDEVPPRVMGEEAVAAVADALERIDPDELRRRFDPAALVQADVYPPALWHQEDALDYLLERFADLVWFYKRAAALGWAVLVFTTL